MSDSSPSPEIFAEGIYNYIKQAEAKPSEVPNPELKQILEKFFQANIQRPQKRQIWLFGDAPRRFHEALGDKGFANMLENCEITTDTTGYEYIEQFNQRYED